MLRKGSALFAISVLLTGCTTMDAPEQLTGTLAGDIRFINTSAALQSYFAAHPARPSGSTLRFTPTGASTIAASGSYSLASPGSNSAVSSSVWKVAGYEVTLPVAPGGTQFLVEAHYIYLQDGGNYRFGFRSAGTAASHQSPPVSPATSTAYDVEECAELVTVNVKLKGATPADLAPLEAAPSLAYTCVAEAHVDDTGTASFNPQARSSDETTSIATLTSASGAAIAFPVRAHGQATGFRASCAVTPPAGSGYALDNSGRAVFSENGITTPVSCGAGSGSLPPIELIVQRDAGDLEGRFDIVGYDESYAQVTLTMPGTSVYRSATPTPLPSNQPSPASWSMTSVQTGDATVNAGASIAGGDMGLLLPGTSTPNPRATVTAGGMLNLGNTFVAKPVESAGRLHLVDPARTTRLDKLRNTGNVSWASGTDTSYMVAEGDPALVGAVPGSAVGGISIGRLNGAYVPSAGCLDMFTQGCWTLGYRLLFSGLSPIGGALDGTDTRRTAWNVRRASLLFSDPSTDHWQNMSVNFSREMRFYSREPDAAPPELPSLGVCVGQVELEFVADPATGLLFDPSFSFNNAVVSGETTIYPSDVLSSNGNSRGRPALEANAALSARVVATVPEGASYNLSSAVTIKAPSGSGTRISGLPQILLPANGRLACSQVTRACMKINSPVGSTAQALQVSVGDQPYCRAGGSVALEVIVESAGVPVDSIDYKVDGGSSVNHCTGCGPISASSPITITPAGQPFPAGPHTIEIAARSENGCTAVTVYSFNACPSPAKPQHLAFFDGNALKLHSVVDGSQLLPDITLPGGAGPISFNHDGSKMAVLSVGASVTMLDPASAATLSTESANFKDFAFRPGSLEDRAYLEEVVPGSAHFLRVVVGTSSGSQLLLAPPGANRPAPRLAWSDDGSKIAVIYTQSAGAGNEVEAKEFSVASGALIALPAIPPRPLATGERLVAVRHVTGSLYLVVTDRGLYGLIASALIPVVDVPVNFADVHRRGITAFAFDVSWPTPPNTMPVVLWHDLAASLEPMFGTVRGVAVSNYEAATESILAVARSSPVVAPGQPYFVAVYRLQNNQLVRDRLFNAQQPRYPAFRPRAP